MISDRRLLANRANAKKSTGPKTPDGKAKSSLNGLRHGLRATTFVLANEDLEEYTQFRNEFMTRFGPRDQVEIELIDRMVHASWSLRRTWTMENEILNLQMFRMEADLAKRYVDLPERTRTAAAFEELAKQPTLPLLHRYEARQSNEYQRALKTLLELRKNVSLAPAGTLLPDCGHDDQSADPPPADVPASFEAGTPDRPNPIGEISVPNACMDRRGARTHACHVATLGDTNFRPQALSCDTSSLIIQ